MVEIKGDFILIKLHRMIEEKFIKELFNNEKGFEIINGNNSIIVSAPHSVSQIRNGKIKTGEFKTGLIAILLNELANCHVIYKTKNNNDDANYDEYSCYKNELAEYIKKNNIKVLLDIHLCSSSRKFDFDIGTGKKNNIIERYDILNIIINRLSQRYEYVVVDDLFPASYQFTVSSFISREACIPCFQVEINWKNINSSEKITLLIEDFKYIIEKINEIA